jgi:myo-inositol 2-dehydrogenase/D-chiro-inositol 1-dehydrogenase
MLRLALVGAGRMGRQHVDAVAASDRAVITAVADPAGAPGLDVPVHDSVDRLLDAGGFDAAIVAVPTRFHVETVRRLAEAGVPMLCEKPCGLDAPSARTIAGLVGGLPFRVGYWRRQVPELRELRDRIASGEMGDVQLVVCFHWDERPPPAAFRDPRSSGGVLVDVAVHEIDMTRWLTGQEVAEVRLAEATVTSEPPVPGDPESAALMMTTSGGALGLVTVGRRFADGDHQRVEVIGTDAVAAVPFGVGEAGLARIAGALRNQVDSFADLVEGGASQGAGVDDAIAALEVVERAARLP